MTPAPRISWELNLEERYPYGPVSPDPARLEPLGFPPPWPDRPWIYSNVITSQNGLVAWTRSGPGDDPIRAIAGGDFTRPGRRADVQLMRYLRACADAVSVGAQTLREQPELAPTLGHAGSDLGDVLERFRIESRPAPASPPGHLHAERLSRPRTSASSTRRGSTCSWSRLTTAHGGSARSGGARPGPTLLVAGDAELGPAEMRRAHQRLFGEFGVRYLDCEGGVTILDALHGAGLVDEVFVTVTGVRIDPDQHDGVKRLFALDAARLIAEGHTATDADYVFRRFRINER